MRQRNVMPMNILEQHISRWALPNEEILSWIKWDPSVDFDRIVVRTEADIALTRILNVDTSELEPESAVEGEAVIDRDMLQIPGFVGFASTYRLVPESERQIRFEVAFVKNGKRLETVSLKTSVIRPVIVIEMERGIDVSGVVLPVQPATFKLLNRGKAPATDLEPFIEFADTKAMTVTIEYTKEKVPYDPNMPFVSASEQTIPKFALIGSGEALLALGFKFKDSIGNDYTTELVKIPVTKPEKRKVKVPIESMLSGQPAMVLASTRY